MTRITGIRKERLKEIIQRDAQDSYTTQRNGKKFVTNRPLPIPFQSPLSDNQFRAAIVQDNLSTPIRPRSLKAPKPLPQQVKHSSAVRSNDNPTELGKASPRFHDPVGNAFRARTEFKPDKGFDPLWIGYPDTDTDIGDQQPTQCAYTYRAITGGKIERVKLGDKTVRVISGGNLSSVTLTYDADYLGRVADAVLQYTYVSNRNRDRGFKPEEKPLPLVSCLDAYPVQRVGKLAKASATKPISRTLAWRDYFSRCTFHHVLASLPDTAPVTPRPLQTAMRQCPLPKVLPLPPCDTMPALGLPTAAQEKRNRSPSPVVVTVDKVDQSTHLTVDNKALVSIDTFPWTSVTRKRLWERVEIRSRSAKKRGFRYIPKKPHTAIAVMF